MSPRRVPLLLLAVFAVAAFAAACAAESPPEGDCLAPGPDGTMISVPCPENDNGAPAATPTPAPVNGNDVPPGQAVFQNSGCGACHTIQGVPGAVGAVGPDLTEVGARAGDRIPDLSAEEYLRQKLVDPESYTVEGFQPGVMPSFDRLSEEDLSALVEFLAALR